MKSVRSAAKRRVSIYALVSLLSASPYAHAARCAIELSGAPNSEWRAAV